MHDGHSRCRIAGAVLCAFLGLTIRVPAQNWEIQPGDRIAIIGNAFADNMRRYGYLETLLRSRYPEYNLTVRNMGWSGDTLTLQPRPLNFGTTERHLRKERIDVVVLCFGMVESFDGVQAAERFEAELRRYVLRFKAAKFNGKTAPRIVLVSPIYHEQLGPPLPDAAEHNRSIARYSAVMEKVARELGVKFVDLLTPSKELNERKPPVHLTENGIHPGQLGYWYLCQIIADAMTGGSAPVEIDVDVREKKARVRGVQVEAVTGGRGTVEIRVQARRLMVPPPPSQGAVPLPRPFLERLPQIRIRGLERGRYALQVGDRSIAVAEAGEWARGVRLTSLPAQEQAERLRHAVVEKNEYWFYRWRPHNTEYIFGRRRRPFGIVSFPPEMAAWDRLIAEKERELEQLSQPLPPARFRIVRLP